MRILFFTLFLFSTNCFARAIITFPTFKIKQITHKENLCDPFSINIIQDNDGLMWVGTNTGLNRLDGYRVKSFFYNPTKDNGLSNNTIVDFNNNFNNKLWISTGNGICNYNYETKTIQRVTNEFKIKENDILYATFINAKDKLLCIDNINGGWHTIDKFDKIQNLKFQLNFDSIKEQLKNGKYENIIKSESNYWMTFKSILININLNTLKIQDAINFGETFKTNQLFKAYKVNNYLWLSTWGKGLLRYDLASKELLQVKSAYLNTKETLQFKDVYGKNWIVTTHENGYTIVDPITLEAKDFTLGTPAYFVFVDKQNTIWFGTQNGLFYAENKKESIVLKEIFDTYIHPTQLKNNTLKTIPWNVFSTKEFYFVPLTDQREMLKFDKNWKFIKTLINNQNSHLSNEYITGIYENDNFYWVTTLSGLVKCNKDFNVRKWFKYKTSYTKINDVNKIKSLKIVNKNTLLLRANYSFHLFDVNKEVFTKNFIQTTDEGIKNNMPQGGPLVDLVIKNNYCYLIMQSNGLNKMNLSTGEIQNIALPYNNIALTKMVLEDDDLWIGSYNGVIKYNTKTGDLKTYLQQNGLHNDIIVGMKMDINKVLWLFTASGVSCIDTKTDIVKNLFKKTGISGGNAYGEKINIDDNGNIVFGYENYIGFIDSKILNEVEVPKKSIITDLMVNNITILWGLKKMGKYISLANNENSIALNFTIENAEGNNTYFYKLNGKWHSVNSGLIELAGLESGTYKIIVANQPKDTALNDVITINIRPIFYKSWWFLLLSIFIIASIFYAFFKVKTNSIRKQILLQKTYEQKISDSEMQTLRSQMNPHFLFNTLNSINSYIIQNKTNIASEYLTTFSKLMRNILELSKQEKVTVEKEIHALKMYIELEALRLENKFDYSITIDKSIEQQSTFLPSLIIQPFVENAIWHGLHNKQDAGHININVGEQNNQLIITIEDDGIGRKAAAALKKQTVNHKSFGIDITINRIKLLDAQNSIHIIDLYNNTNTAVGTKVIITINNKQYD